MRAFLAAVVSAGSEDWRNRLLQMVALVPAGEYLAGTSHQVKRHAYSQGLTHVS